MARASIEVPVEPKVLVWARESIGKSVEDAARKLGKNIDIQIVKELESGARKPRLAQLEKLANLYKRPLAVFLLSEPPKEPPLPEDFRTLPKEKKEPFSPETRLAIRRARRLQRLYVDLAKEAGRAIESQTKKAVLPERLEGLRPKAEALAEMVRGKFKADIENQYKWKNSRQALKKWRCIIESRKVLVFQMSMPFEETRGFSLTDDTLPTIVLNTNDSINGKIFSLFHEYAHLMLHHGGICDMGYRNTQEIEIFCNHFAGAFLVPRTNLLSHERVKKQKGIEWSEEDLGKLAGFFKVSKEVILRRFLVLDKTTEKFYNHKKSEWHKEWEEKKKKKEDAEEKKGWRNVPSECLRNRGIPFISLVVEAYEAERITSTDVADYLGIRLQHLPTIEALIRKPV